MCEDLRRKYEESVFGLEYCKKNLLKSMSDMIVVSVF